MNNENQFDKNIEALQNEQDRLKEQNGKSYASYQETIGGDVYTRYGKHHNTERIKEIDQLIKNAQENEERQIRSAQIAHENDGLYKHEARMEEIQKNGKFSYNVGNETYKTNDPALAARYDAQHRFFAMSKTQQAIAKMNGQWAKFNKLWQKVDKDLSQEEKQNLAQELDTMFRR